MPNDLNFFCCSISADKILFCAQTSTIRTLLLLLLLLSNYCNYKLWFLVYRLVGRIKRCCCCLHISFQDNFYNNRLHLIKSISTPQFRLQFQLLSSIIVEFDRLKLNRTHTHTYTHILIGS